MSDETPYTIPDQPPPDALAELDVAARSLDVLSRQGTLLTLGMEEQTRTLRVEVDEGAGMRVLTPTQLFGLLGSS